MRLLVSHRTKFAAVAVCTVALPLTLRAATAEEFDGVQPAALDQPRVNVLVRHQQDGVPLSGKTELGAASNVEAFLDTGASGLLLSDHTASLLGIVRERSGRDEVRFEDVGVGGGDTFAVSEKVFVAIAPSDADVDIPPDSMNGVYRQRYGPLRTQIGPLVGPAGGGLMETLTREVMGDLDVVGMPTMVGKVVVMDARPVNEVTDKMRTVVLDPRVDGLATIPQIHRHVRLSFAPFNAYTKTTPPAAEAPEMAANPCIGPAPVDSLDSAPQPLTRPHQIPPITITEKGKQSAGSWLLDTGAAASMLSRQQAAAVGVTYDPKTDGSDSPKLLGVPVDQQFTMTIGGIGGSKKAAGFYIDRLTLQTTEGRPITYLHAPVLISDIKVKDSRTGKSLTLDGVFGMNFLVASAKITEDILPDIDHITPGPYRWIVFDQPKGLLGLD